MINWLYFFLFVSTVPVSNWMISNFGQCVENGPCLIPVGFGLMAPSGVLVIGAALVLRDIITERMGVKYSFYAISLGAVATFFVAPQALAIASLFAFIFSETADSISYEVLKRKGKPLAVVVSGFIGAITDSAIFLFLAFGNLMFIEGQIVGKMWASLFAAVLIATLAKRAAR